MYVCMCVCVCNALATNLTPPSNHSAATKSRPELGPVFRAVCPADDPTMLNRTP